MDFQAASNTKSQVTVANWTSKFGGSAALLPESGAFYFIGLAADNQRFRETGILGFEALADTSILVGVVKLATHRERPLEGNGNGTFWSNRAAYGTPVFLPATPSTPGRSHRSSAHEYPHPRIVPILAYSLATTVGGSRFAARKHFASDVVLGAAMGWFIGDYVYAKRHNRELEKRSALDRLMAHVHLGGPTILEMPDDAEAVKAGVSFVGRLERPHRLSIFAVLEMQSNIEPVYAHYSARVRQYRSGESIVAGRIESTAPRLMASLGIPNTTDVASS
jgi:hypothetical protein